MAVGTDAVLTAALNAVKTAYPRAEAYIDLSIPGAANGSGDPLAAIMVAAVTSIVPTTNRDFGTESLTSNEQTELYDLIARRIDRMITDLTTVKAAIVALRPGSSITLVT